VLIPGLPALSAQYEDSNLAGNQPFGTCRDGAQTVAHQPALHPHDCGLAPADTTCSVLSGYPLLAALLQSVRPPLRMREGTSSDQRAGRYTC